MARPRGESGDVALDYIERYAQMHSKRHISKMLFEDRPDLFSSPEKARKDVRYLTGEAGRDSRIHAENNRLFFGQYPETEPFELYYDIQAEKAKILVIGDAHVPFHDKRALDAAMNYGVRVGADTIILNGDNFDHYHESRFEKDPHKRDPVEDFEQYQDFLYELRCAFPHARIILKKGNHEKRWELWFVRNNMGKILDIQHFQYVKIMNLDEYNIQLLEEPTTITIGKLNLLHGSEYPGGGGINPARWLSLRVHEPAACGHFHRTSEHTTKKHRGEMVTYWSFGCLCGLNPLYRPYNDWNHGFGFIIKENGDFEVKNKRIWKGRVV